MKEFLKVLSHLHQRDDIYVVGGAVRNWLMGYPLTDFDLAVEGSPHELAEQIAGIVDGDVVNVGKEHNVTRVAKDGEIVFDINGFDDSIEKDLARRDFTVNALAVPLHSWGAERIIIGNKFHIEDAHHKVLRPMSPNIFRDDGARLLRAFRFSKQYNMFMSYTLRDMVQHNKQHLNDATPERVIKEFLAILALNDAWKHIVDLEQMGLLQMVIPEVVACRNVQQPIQWHDHDVYWHQIYVLRFTEELMQEGGGDQCAGDFSEYFDQKVANGQTRRTLMKLAALTHDTGKPMTQQIDKEKDDIHFYGHAGVGENIMRHRLRELRMAGKNIDMVCKLIRNHMRVHDILDGKATPRAIHRFCRDLDDNALDMLVLGLGDRRGQRTFIDHKKWDNYLNGFNRALTLSKKPVNQPRARSSYVDGKFIKRSLGVEQGPLVGELLKAVIEAEAIGEVTNQEEAFLLMESIIFGGENEKASEEVVRDETSRTTPTTK